MEYFCGSDEIIRGVVNIRNRNICNSMRIEMNICLAYNYEYNCKAVLLTLIFASDPLVTNQSSNPLFTGRFKSRLV